LGRTSPKWPILWRCVLFFSRPRSEGWPHHGRTFSIFLCPLSLWLTLLQGVLSTSWCCPSRPCVVFLACAHLALFLSLSLSPGNSLVFSWCDHSMLASLLWRCLTVSSTPASLRTVKEPTHLFSLLSTKPTESIAVLSSQRRQDVFLYFNWVFSFHSSTLLQARLALSLVVSSWFFHIFCSDAPSWSHVAHRIRASCRFIIPPPGREVCDRNIVTSLSLDLSLSVFAYPRNHKFRLHQIFYACYSLGSVTVRYVLPALWMTSYFSMLGFVAHTTQVGCELKMTHQGQHRFYTAATAYT